jgi:rsbT co-antagonist protein RsbR
MVDTAVASALLQMARGVRLLGATPVLVGIRGEVAQTMVALGVDLRRIVTRAGLQEGLEYAREVLGTGAVKT